MDLKKNRPCLDLPLTDRKLVLAHNMTNFIHFQGNHRDLFMKPELYFPDGPSSSMGGMFQYRAVAGALPAYSEMSLEEAVEFEMRTALKLGVDGFQFFYPRFRRGGFAEFNTIIKAFFRVADEKKIDFKLTLCLCLPAWGTQAEKIEAWSEAIRDLLDATGKSPAWFKTPDGRTLFYIWVGDPLSDAVQAPWGNGGRAELIKPVAEAYEELAQACGLDIAYIYHLQSPDEASVEAALDYFPAVWDWIDVDPDSSRPAWAHVARRCRERNRAYTQTVFSDFYGSKLFDASQAHRLMFDPQEILAKAPQGVVRHCNPTQLSRVFRLLLERAVETDAALVNYVTWNDFPEGHQLAPEINHNFGFALLLDHFKRRWQGKPPSERELAALFYKKYPVGAKPRPFNIPYLLKRFGANESRDDFVDVVTILNSAAELWFKGRNLGPVGPGLVSTLIPTEKGRVEVEIKRGPETILSVRPPEWITDRPFRTDRFTYAYTSECPRLYREIFGGQEVPVCDDYAEGPEGVPNWKKRYKF